MTFKLLAGALALGVLVPPASAIERSQDGSGQAVLLPYYSVEDGLSTVFSVTNHGDQGKAVRVVIAEGLNGRVALSFNVYLAARDTWSGAIVADPEGAPLLPRMLTVDGSCTSAAINPTGVALRSVAFTGSRNDGLPGGGLRVETGQIELIELGTLGPAVESLAEAENCNVLRLRFQAGGAWAADINADIGAPNGGISGEAQLIDVAGGVAFNTEPFVIENFSNAARHGNGANDYDAARIYKPTGVNAGNDFAFGGARVTVQRPADAVSLMMMAAEFEGGYTISDAVDASTRFVLTFPTRPAYLDNLPGGEVPAGLPIAQPFFGADVSAGAPYCVQTTWRSIDRDGDLGAPSELPMCGQVNEVDIAADAAEGVFGVGAVQQGRIRVGLHPERHALVFTSGPVNGNGVARGLPVLAHALMEVRNTNAQPGLLASYAISGRIVRKHEGAIDF